MVTKKIEMYLQKVQTLNEKIKEESMMIDEYQSNIDDLENEISDYENDYDYEIDPNGNDYDLNLIYELREEIERIEKLINRCEWEIQCYEEELIQFEFWLGDCSIQLLLHKWETKLNGFITKRNDCDLDYSNGDYQSEEDFQSDWSKWSGKIDVTNQIIEDIKHIIEKSELKLNK